MKHVLRSIPLLLAALFLSACGKSDGSASSASVSPGFSLLGSQTARYEYVAAGRTFIVRFRPTHHSVPAAPAPTGLRVLIMIDGEAVTKDIHPSYGGTADQFGFFGETSNAIDLSGRFFPGERVIVQVTDPESDWRCGDGSCENAVPSDEAWGGELLVDNY